jgi:hypothetical protein
MNFAPFNIALQVIAAFAIFVLGYVALFVSLIISLALSLAVGKGIYEVTRRVRAYAARLASASDTPDHRRKPFLNPGLEKKTLPTVRLVGTRIDYSTPATVGR